MSKCENSLDGQVSGWGESQRDEENYFLFWWVAEPLDDMLKYKYDYKTKYKYIQYKYSAMKKIWWLAESDAQDVISGPEK